MHGKTHEQEVRTAMKLMDAIMERRSVRKFTDYRVTDREIEEMIDAARWAPSWANTQVWEFLVVRDGELIEKITGTYSKGNPATKCSLTASALVVICAQTGVSGAKGDGDATKHPNWFMFDTGLAVQNLCLKAHELGLGTVIVGFMDHDACKVMLGVPDGYEVVAVVPVGKPAVEGKKGPPRRALEECAHLNTFGTPFRP